MKKLDLGQTITILANVGVIAGIVFLAIELRQNNRLLVAEAEFNQLQHLQDIGMVLFENPEVADMYTRALDGDELDRVEQRKNAQFSPDPLARLGMAVSTKSSWCARGHGGT